MRRWRPSIGRAAAVSLAALAALLLAGVAYASWSRTATGGPLTVATATLDAPTGLGTSNSCAFHSHDYVVVSWTASTSPAVANYQILRGTTSGGPYASVGTVAVGTNTFTDMSPPYDTPTTYYYVVRSTHGGWTSPYSNQSSILTLDKNCH
jgi:hypothetical protein